MDRLTAISRYEENLLGKSNKMLRGTPEEKEKNAIDLIRYIVLELIQDDPLSVIQYIDDNLAKQYLFPRISTYIQSWPKDIGKRDWDYMIHLAFPKETKNYSLDQALRIHQRILRGEAGTFPHNYFDGVDGDKKAAVLLRHTIAEHIHAETVADLYYFFYDPMQARNFLKEWGLFDVCKDHFNTPLEFLHLSLPKGQKDEFLYKFLTHQHCFKYHTYIYNTKHRKKPAAE